MKIRIYDGAQSIGGTKIYIGNEKNGLFLDFGLNFEKINKYFKNFIKIRDIRGLHDPIEMDLLPKINVYRKDLFTRDVRTTHWENVPLDAVLITHAHLDHYGMLGYVDFDVPVVASPETFAIIKAYQDMGQSEIGKDVLFAPPREASKYDGLVLSKKRITKKEVGEGGKCENLLMRELYTTYTPSDNFFNFMILQNGNKKADCLKDNLKVHTNLDELPFSVKAYSVDHSIYGAVGYIIGTETGNIVYTGDFRMHGANGASTEIFKAHAKNAHMLIVEGTRLNDELHARITEKDVLEKCAEVVENEKGLIIADFSARNFERLKEFEDIANKEGRVLVITEKDAYAIHGINTTKTKIPTDNLLVLDKLKGKKEGWMNALDSWNYKMIKAEEIKRNPENYILAFSLYDFPTLMDIKPKGGTYIYSSTEAFSEDMELDFYLIWNWLKKYNIKSAGFTLKDGKLEFQRGFHASGHVHPQDLFKFIDEVNPDIIIPVHTKHPEAFVKMYGDKIHTDYEFSQ